MRWCSRCSSPSRNCRMKQTVACSQRGVTHATGRFRQQEQDGVILEGVCVPLSIESDASTTYILLVHLLFIDAASCRLPAHTDERTDAASTAGTTGDVIATSAPNEDQRSGRRRASHALPLTRRRRRLRLWRSHGRRAHLLLQLHSDDDDTPRDTRMNAREHRRVYSATGRGGAAVRERTSPAVST